MILKTVSFLILAFLQLAASTSTGDCTVPSVLRQGFDAFKYPYPLHDKQGFNPDGSMNQEFYREGYKKLGEKRNWAMFLKNIHIEGQPDARGGGVLYGKLAGVSSFTLEFEGFYKAPRDGEYTINLAADDQMSIQVGEGRRGSCKDLFQPARYLFEAATKVPADSDARNNDLIRTTSLTVTMREGLYYPVKMVYFNAGGHYMIQTSIVAPHGQPDYYWGDNIYQFDQKRSCPSTPVGP